jgi:hypothetical protein
VLDLLAAAKLQQPQLLALSVMAPATDNLPQFPAPDIPGVAHKKDYVAACPKQHLEWLSCIREHAAVQITACLEQQERLAACIQAAKPAHLREGNPPAMLTYWQQFQQDPYVLQVVDYVRGLEAKVGIGGSSTDDESQSAR